MIVIIIIIIWISVLASFMARLMGFCCHIDPFVTGLISPLLAWYQMLISRASLLVDPAVGLSSNLQYPRMMMSSTKGSILRFHIWFFGVNTTDYWMDFC